MRENKFRVYYEFKFQGKIEKGMASPASWFLIPQTGKLWTYEPDSAPQPISKEYIKAIPLFYTGKKDKKKNEVYDGDIVNVKPFSDISLKWSTGEVKWIAEYFTWGVKCFYENSKEFYTYLFQQIDEIEKIGNIYENPELFKEEK